MTTEQIAKHLHDHLPEFVDAYFIVGQTIDGEPIARYWAPDQESADRMNTILRAVVAAGGLPKVEIIEREICRE